MKREPTQSTAMPPMTKAEDAPQSLRVAIIGCGPRGLQCLEAMSRRLSRQLHRRISITVFEPAEFLGAGMVYNPSQPKTLRMNFATQHIDFWKTKPDHRTARSGSLLGWLAQHYPEYAATNQYVPRAIVGKYLHDCYNKVVSQIKDTTTLRVIPEKVIEIQKRGSRFSVHTDTGLWHFDQVAITTGHEGLRSSPTTQAGKTPIPAIPAGTHLTVDRVTPGSRVLVHGFGLTAIDTVLSLTEGRGGSFDSDRILPRYRKCSLEPARIDLRSRSGRPMLSKPAANKEPISDDFWTPFRHRLNEHLPNHGKLEFVRDIWSIVTDAAAHLLVESGSHTQTRVVDGWYQEWTRCKMDSRSAQKTMLQSYAVATGKRPIDIPYALGDSWRRLYPELVALISNGGLTDDSWNSFALTAREMERIAFGPPAENIGRLLSLMRSRLISVGNQLDSTQHYDHTINSVIAGPHQHDHVGPLEKLIQAGLVQVHPASGGVMVDCRGFVIGETRGLAIFGRATEGWVVGNDTLNRTLHCHIENWAEEIATLAASTENHLL
ncbi:FAD/NAD(P)-binding protein [Neorhodopirellula lusitana]|uniref:FAD/NAD(P)-binding protein n=1 Tax=Neorhodopirellula lusitana TaxID=445327 RepID=UPI00384E078B